MQDFQAVSPFVRRCLADLPPAPYSTPPPDPPLGKAVPETSVPNSPSPQFALLRAGRQAGKRVSLSPERECPTLVLQSLSRPSPIPSVPSWGRTAKEDSVPYSPALLRHTRPSRRGNEEECPRPPLPTPLTSGQARSQWKCRTVSPTLPCSRSGNARQCPLLSQSSVPCSPVGALA